MDLRNRLLLIFLLILIALTACPQLNSGNLTQYSENNGLPAAQVNKLLVDRFGYIWVGTINGLARFDGYEFKRFYSNPNDTTAIQGLIVWSLFEDHKGQVWIGSSPSYLNVYNPVIKNFRQLDFAHLVDHPANVELLVAAMCEDNKGRIYFGVNTYLNERISSALLYKDENDNKIKRFISPDSLVIQNVFGLTKDMVGNVWLLSYSGLFKIDTAGKMMPVYSLDQEIKKNQEVPTDIKVDNRGHTWIITSTSRLYDFNPQTGTYKSWFSDKLPGNPEQAGRVIALEKSGNIWLTSSAGVQYFNRKTGEFSIFNSGVKKQLEPTLANHIALDSFGTLWLGSFSEGLLKYENKAQLNSYIYHKNDKNSITSGWANYLYEGSDGKIWIGTSGSASTSGINVLNSHTGMLTPIPFSRFPGMLNGVFSIWENTPGELYIGGFKSLFTFSEKTQTVKPIVLPGAPDTLTILYYLKDSRENEWLCTLTGLFKKNKGAQLFRKYDLSSLEGSNASSNQVTKAYESKKHGLWLTTDNGLFLYDYPSDKIERQGFDKSRGDIFVTQDINSFCEDKNGLAWVGSWQGGLSNYNVETKKIFTYTRNNGLPSMSVQSILPDNKNECLWLSTFEGLSRFNIKTQQFNNFSIADGIQGQLFADGSCLKTSSGLIAFGGSNGITIFNPDEIAKNSVPPKVFLTELRVFNRTVIPGKNSLLKRPLYESKEITLSYNNNNISLEFSALHYSNPEKNRISYKLEKYDNDWRDAGSEHAAFYPNLPPGEYNFRVKAANDKGVWNNQGASLKIVVNYPWWRSTFAYILYALLTLCLALFTYRYFQHRLVQKERERGQARELEQAKEIEKAYYELAESHQALKSTQMQLIQSEKMASLGALTAGIAHEIQNPLNFINNFSEINTELIDELQKELYTGNNEVAVTISTDIKENEKRIMHHGKRADAIVKGMLQHSRRSSSHLELTDINALADEYLRLSYFGLKAKDKNLQAVLSTHFDKSISAITVIPQDIGRVLLNLYNNAFYTVNDKKQSLPALRNGEKEYEPLVSVTTKMLQASPGGQSEIEISIKDNGKGIPEKNLDKIFQPFFTTKPAGQGTGLGLSLSYDIIKAHGGEIKVETKEGEGSEFIIQLPFEPTP